MVAYLARYGNQQIPHLMNMRIPELQRFAQALSDLVADENAQQTSAGPGEED